MIPLRPIIILALAILLYVASVVIYRFKKPKGDQLIIDAEKAKNSGNLPQAIELYSQATKELPQNWFVYYSRGLCYKDKKDFENAKKDFELAIKINPKWSLAAKKELDTINSGEIKLGENFDDVFR